jgi:hypothetical protein
MDRQEVENLSQLYRLLEQADADQAELWSAMNKAHEYAFNDPDPTHMTSDQLTEQAKLTADCFAINFRWAVDLQNIQYNFPDFEAGPSPVELERDSQYVRDAQDTARIAPALARTTQRLADARQQFNKLADAAEKK